MTGESEQSSTGEAFAPIFWLLIGGIFTTAVNTQVMNPVLPAVSDDFGASVGRAGLTITAYLLPYGFFQLFYGPIADRTGRVKVIAFALGMSAIATLLCALAPSLGSLVAFRAATGATAAAVTPLTLTYIGDTVPYLRRHQAIGYSAMSISLGNIAAAALGGLAAALIDWRAIFIFIAIFSAILTVFIVRQPTMRARPAIEPGGWLDPFRIMLVDRRHLLFYLMILIEGMIIFGSVSFFGYVLRERDDFSYLAIGFILAVFGLTSAVAGRYLGAISQRLSEPRMVLAGGSMASVGFALFTISPVIPVGVVGLALVGGGMIIMHTTFQMRATELLPSARATGITIFAFALFLGASIGSLVLAQAFDRAGFTPTLIGLACVMAVFTVVASRGLLGVTRPHSAEAVRYTEPA